MNYIVFEKYRKKKKLTQQQIEKKLGKSPGWYSKLINGHMNLRPQHIAPMAEALGIKAEKLAKEYFSDHKLEDTSSDESA